MGDLIYKSGVVSVAKASSTEKPSWLEQVLEGIGAYVVIRSDEVIFETSKKKIGYLAIDGLAVNNFRSAILRKEGLSFRYKDEIFRVTNNGNAKNIDEIRAALKMVNIEVKNTYN